MSTIAKEGFAILIRGSEIKELLDALNRYERCNARGSRYILKDAVEGVSSEDGSHMEMVDLARSSTLELEKDQVFSLTLKDGTIVGRGLTGDNPLKDHPSAVNSRTWRVWEVHWVKDKLACLRCGHEWTPSHDWPEQCPKCIGIMAVREGVEASSASEQDSPKELLRHGDNRINVLCVEDDRNFLELERTALERYADMITDGAMSVPEALEKLKGHSYDAVVSDYMMSMLTGIDLLRFLRSAGNSIPFIILTGKGNDQVALEAMAEGATFFMEKGCDQRLMFSEIASMVRVSVEGILAKKKVIEFETICSSLCKVDSSAVMILDREGRILDCTTSIEEIIGYCEEEVIGKPFIELAEGKNLHESLAKMETLMKNDIAQVVNLEIRRKDSKTIPAMICTSSLQCDDRDQRRAVCVIKDISERKAMENNYQTTRRLCADLEEVLDEMVAQSSPKRGPSVPKSVS